MALSSKAHCPICNRSTTQTYDNDFTAGREGVVSTPCAYGYCRARERSLANVLYSLFPRHKVAEMDIHELAPGGDGLSLHLQQTCSNRLASGYFPDKPFGEMVGTLRNEDAGNQTFADESFDLVVHLDVMEHLFQPFQALREIKRTLRPDGICLFTAPTEAHRINSVEVARVLGDGSVEIDGTPEYHGNPQSEHGSLVTWRYGYDLPVLINRETGFNVEVRRFQAFDIGVFGIMNEVYILRK